MTVAVVVDEGASCSPRFAGACYTGLLGDLSEDTVLIVIETVLSVVGEVQIVPTVIVVVADADALPPANRGQASFSGDVSERAIVIVVVEVVRGALPGRKSLNLCAIHQKHVRPTVIGVIDYRNAGYGGLDHVFLGVI